MDEERNQLEAVSLTFHPCADGCLTELSCSRLQ